MGQFREEGRLTWPGSPFSARGRRQSAATARSFAHQADCSGSSENAVITPVPSPQGLPGGSCRRRGPWLSSDLIRRRDPSRATPQGYRGPLTVVTNTIRSMREPTTTQGANRHGTHGLQGRHRHRAADDLGPRRHLRPRPSPTPRPVARAPLRPPRASLPRTAELRRRAPRPRRPGPHGLPYAVRRLMDVRRSAHPSRPDRARTDLRARCRARQPCPAARAHHALACRVLAGRPEGGRGRRHRARPAAPPRAGHDVRDRAGRARAVRHPVRGRPREGGDPRAADHDVRRGRPRRPAEPNTAPGEPRNPRRAVPRRGHRRRRCRPHRVHVRHHRPPQGLYALPP